MWKLFGKRKAGDDEIRHVVRQLGERLGEVESELRTYQTEQVAMHDQVRKWMRRAVAAERAAAVRESGGASPSQLPRSRAALFGARARIMARRAERAARPDPVEEEPEVSTNGVHP